MSRESIFIGIYTYSDGGFYDGDWKNHKKEGYGIVN
jgi:hypothetical protein